MFAFFLVLFIYLLQLLLRFLLFLQVVIDAFRLINPNAMVLGPEPRQTTSNLGHLQKPSIQVSGSFNSTLYNSVSIERIRRIRIATNSIFTIVVICLNMSSFFFFFLSFFQALIHGLNRHYYSIAINYRKNELEQKVSTDMLRHILFFSVLETLS